MLETDYLIIGSGASAMAFTDTLLAESDAEVLIVDRYPKPGGHWNYAYPFVTLHQPSQFYGVSSRELSNGKMDETGWNKGLFSLASGSEIRAYFEAVMRDQFLPTGRVQYFPSCDYTGNHAFTSLLTGDTFQVKVRKKVVDTTILKTGIPSMHTPNYSVAEGVPFMPLNDLPKITTPPEGFVVIGGGKTGIDAILWLLENQVHPDKITWIVSRDAWLLDRRNAQPSIEHFDNTFGTVAKQFEAIAGAEDLENLFDRLEEAGVMLRIDQSIRPQMFHGATISLPELEQLRRLKNVVRMGRVQRIESDRIILDRGEIPTSTKQIHVDCSASAATNLETKPIFQGDLITPQTVRAYQPVFSASIVAYVETHYKTDEEKNQLLQVVRLPDRIQDWVPMMANQFSNQAVWGQDRKLSKWLKENRLNGFGNIISEIDRTDMKRMGILKRMRDGATPALVRLQELNTAINAPEEKAIENPQFQVFRKAFVKNRLVDAPATSMELEEGEILLKVDKFAYTANNMTYAAAGDMIGYWQFFPPYGEDPHGWGVIPVWGFADVVASTNGAIKEGERLFGYFPPSKHLKLKPSHISNLQFIDASDHRKHLPAGYNLYRRVSHEPGYNAKFDNERMVLWPMHLTSWCIWDSLQMKDFYGAEQIISTSASSKTASGFGYTLKADPNAPKSIGMTSARNLDMVNGLGLYAEGITYDDASKIANVPTVIVDFAGNAKVMGAMHKVLGDNMKKTINVGITHFMNARPNPDINAERVKMFFAPGHVAKRIKDWGPKEFDQKTMPFLMETAAKTREWLAYRELDGLQGLAEVHPAVFAGNISPKEGLIVKV
ncbi:MAG: DUF2855 family protein [Bacteroidota bacterium]